MVMNSDTPRNDAFLRACHCEPVDHIPVWYMRQAGRYQPEYREIKKTRRLIDIVTDPELCAQVTILPVDQLNVDAAILFSDIIMPITPMGIAFEIRDGVGPCLDTPIREEAHVKRLSVPDFVAEMPYVSETIHILRNQLSVPLIGFCGAPFTLACYLVEGGPSKHFTHVKRTIHGNPDMWNALMEVLTAGMAAYLRFQADCGAQALQIFDSWVGTLGVVDYRSHVLPYLTRLVAEVKRHVDVPIIYFGVQTGHLLESIAESGCDVIGLDWRVSIADARRRVPANIALQGNLDPGLLLGPWVVLEAHAKSILDQIDAPGFIFNLGHGVTPQTPVESLHKLTQFVHNYTKSRS